MVYCGIRPGNAPQIEPDLAIKMPEFELKNGRQIWTIHLRKGVRFHAGPQTPSYELTAEDVIYSLEKSKNPETCSYAGSYADMSFIKVNRYTIQIILDKPISPTLFFPKIANYGGGFIISKRAIEKMGLAQYNTHPVGTGPFHFESYEKGGELYLKAHKDYFRGEPETQRG
jgi:peptide/nickel transport system substrate-binding protein